jgi:UDP-N-acetylmuramyl pentapeptide phosphotransferase/UDP-N-acetylglucosamine-1-phosphate transferase
VVLWTGINLNHIDVPYLDYLMNWWPVGVLVTIAAISGMTHAVNILDGFNGLAGGVAIIILVFLASIAFQSDDFLLTNLCLIIVGSISGFMLLNYPFGKIFMGDSGAYFIGFLIGWVALLLPMRNEEISPWTSLLVCAYPVTEVLYSIFRRRLAQLKMAQPDSQHLHSLIKKCLIRRYFKNLAPWAKNALVAPTIWICVTATGCLATYFISDVLALIIFYIIFLFWYWITYFLLQSMPESHD